MKLKLKARELKLFGLKSRCCSKLSKPSKTKSTRRHCKRPSKTLFNPRKTKSVLKPNRWLPTRKPNETKPNKRKPNEWLPKRKPNEWLPKRKPDERLPDERLPNERKPNERKPDKRKPDGLLPWRNPKIPKTSVDKRSQLLQSDMERRKSPSQLRIWL